jgi:hypothetical protein
MDCPRCQTLDHEFVRLDRMHAETAERLREFSHTRAHRDEFRRLQITESDLLLELEIARAELVRHKQEHQTVN